MIRLKEYIIRNGNGLCMKEGEQIGTKAGKVRGAIHAYDIRLPVSPNQIILIIIIKPDAYYCFKVYCFKVYSFIKSQVTYRTCLQSKYRLYEIRPTGPSRR